MASAKSAKKAAKTPALAVIQDDLLAEEIEAVRNELGRVDSKASMLLGLAAGGVVLSSATPPGIAGWVINAGLALAAASLVPLLAVVRPRLGKGGFTRHAQRTPAEVYAELSKADPELFKSEQLTALSRIAVRKFKQLRVAVSLQTAALFLVFAGSILLMI